jgi:chitin synthase
MYRLKSPHGEPLIISNKVISDYFQVSNTTLHEKNLLSLGEDRFLTTLMIKYFPKLRFCFNASAKAATTAPNSFSILLSQRRRWINSTVHNLVELLRLHTMCGLLSVFDMRFFVFIDLAGTILLPSVCAYIGYLIYKIVTVSSQLPIISIIMISAVYGLQAVLFIIRREWQHVGWLLVYLIAYPVHSFLLPVYSFWKQDDFSWGNTRVVYGEKGKSLLYDEENEPFDPLSIPRQFWTTHALIHGLPGAHREYEPGAEAGVSVVRAVEDVLEEMDYEKITVKDVKTEVEKRLGYPAPEIDKVVERWIDKRTL